MKKRLLSIFLCIITFISNATVLYPGLTSDISFEPTTGEYGPTWTTNNPTLTLSSVGFLCHVTAQAYFGGTATVTCTYKDRIGTTTYTRTRNWTFTCIDTSISISPTSKNLKTNESFKITWGFNKPTYITPSIQFTGYDSSIINVSNTGTVTAKAPGETQIYVKSSIGTNSAICMVKVSEESNQTYGGSNSSYDNWDSSNSMKVELEEAGTLSNHINESEKHSIYDLTISGPLNGYDIRLLRDMAGQCVSNGNNVTSNGKLKSIDLKDAYFTSGGSWYVIAWGDYLYSSDSDELPECLFAWCKSIQKIRFPKYITEISNRVTLQCSGISQLSIPPGATTIVGDILNGGYSDMNLQVLHLPSSLTNIDDNIYQCGNLTDIYCYASVPPKIKHPSSFKSQTNIPNGTLYVPKGCAQAYWQSEGWRDFKDIKESLDIFNTLYIQAGEHGIVTYNNNNIEMKHGLYYTGHQAFEVPADQDVIIEIKPNNGYSTSSILLDEKTINIQKDNTLYNLGKLSGHATLMINFEESSSIDNISISSNKTCDVFNIQGAAIAIATSLDNLKNLPKGIYIIKTSGKTTKICIH